MNNKKLSELTEKYLRETDDNVIGVSYGYNIVDGKITNDMAISFSVKKKIPEDQLDPNKIIPKKIKHLNETFITDVVEINEIKALGSISFCYPEHYRWIDDNYTWLVDNGFLPSSARIYPSNRNKIRVLKGGISVTNYTSNSGKIGTLGFFAIDSDGSIVGVSNNHVLIDDAFIATERTNSSLLLT